MADTNETVKMEKNEYSAKTAANNETMSSISEIGDSQQKQQIPTSVSNEAQEGDDERYSIDDGDEVEKMKLFKERSDWLDIHPIHNSDIENSVMPIAASEQFIDAFAYMRAIIQLDERSERALELTERCIDMNPANYTVWQYRRNILKSLQKDLMPELQFVGKIIEDNPKNYQVCTYFRHHRRVIVEWLQNCDAELNFTDEMLRDDAKNYHAWQHRQWVIEHFKLFCEAEIDYSTQLIADDVRNNSAWNYRYFIISSMDGYKDERLKFEIASTMKLIQKTPHNESAWNYLGGILLDGGRQLQDQVLAFCEKLYTETSEKNRSPYLLSHIVNILADKIENGDENAEVHKNRAFKLLDELVELDPIRRKYWNYLHKSIENSIESGVVEKSSTSSHQ